eukprot:CFRG2360T1
MRLRYSSIPFPLLAGSTLNNHNDVDFSIDMVGKLGSATKLQFTVLEADGGEHSPSYRADNMLQDDDTVYCTRKATNVNVSTQFVGVRQGDISVRERSTFSLTHLVIRVPTFGFTSPLKTAIVFVSDQPICPMQTGVFDSFTETDYKNYMAATEKENLVCREDLPRPAGFFSMSGRSSQIVFQLDRPYRGSYILVKLISGTGRTNIDVQHIGFYGQVGGVRAFACGSLSESIELAYDVERHSAGEKSPTLLK